MSKKTWKFNSGLFGGGNHLLYGEGEEFAISYNSNPGSGLSLFDGDGGSDETALCKGGKYYILNGDYRDEYEAIIDQGFDACFQFYQDHLDKRSYWSTDDE
jgi:hypothetical protein|tara:strand:- start:2386 stop:2688 length:303 start_codon:yes stop_codon:yes gene_type:complete